MAVPPGWYEDAFERVAHRLRATHVVHHFQTNAVLIDEAWCRFFISHGVQVGVSVDGPAFIHDAHRKTRGGRGTHDRVMVGISRLREAGIPFHAIAVLTRFALAYVDEMFDFFAALGAQQVGFNVEEIEAVHEGSSLTAPSARVECRRFWDRWLDRSSEHPGLLVRNIQGVIDGLRDPAFGSYDGNQENRLGRIVSVAWDGHVSFWSPELLGTMHPRLGDLTFCNLRDGSLDRALAACRQVGDEIERGVLRCRQSCKYFRLCRGGSPSNKLAENLSFDSTETLACQLGQQVVIDAVLERLDRAVSKQTITASA
jgi:uncharacterized protein